MKVEKTVNFDNYQVSASFGVEYWIKDGMEEPIYLPTGSICFKFSIPFDIFEKQKAIYRDLTQKSPFFFEFIGNSAAITGIHIPVGMDNGFAVNISMVVQLDTTFVSYQAFENYVSSEFGNLDFTNISKYINMRR